ncbi:MAG: DUF4124 domain-containing protein [Porticoccaceae bacterium]|nr:DUF4124 domain-containing protein [Pseudomonadales bacterium]MCP5172445.1 DUF4124 domain-containing protein [Pseudomonadales bacterium]
MGRLILVVLLAVSSVASAQIYRWVDEHGEVHFSDKKPDTGKAEDVSADLKTINVDSSASETEKLSQIFKGETPEEKNYHLDKQKKQQSRMQQACIKAKRNLKTLRGRFYMTGEDGKEIVVSEDEQQRMIESLEEQIRKHCR